MFIFHSKRLFSLGNVLQFWIILVSYGEKIGDMGISHLPPPWLLFVTDVGSVTVIVILWYYCHIIIILLIILLFFWQPIYLHNLSPHTSSQPITSRIYQRLLYLLTNQIAHQGFWSFNWIKPLLHVETFSWNLCATALRTSFTKWCYTVKLSFLSPLRSLQKLKAVLLLVKLVSQQKFKKFHETDHVTRCNACWNMFRNAFSHKFQLKVSTCNSGLKLSLDFEGGFRTCCQNVSHKQKSFSGLQSPRRGNHGKLFRVSALLGLISIA